MKPALIRCLDLRSPVQLRHVPAQDELRLGWRAPLERAELETIGRWTLERGGSAHVRLYGEAVAQLDSVLECIPVATLAIAASRIARAPRGASQVAELVLDGWPTQPRILESFGGVRTLRVEARGAHVDLHDLRALPSLARLSIAGATLSDCASICALQALSSLELRQSRASDVEALLRHPGLCALRLASVERVTSLHALRGHANLRSLALESLLHLESLAPIATLPRLQTLAIAGLWQFNVGDVAFIAGMRGLRELSIDIGGARKNVEITKPLQLPEAPAFDVGDYCLTTSYEFGVQSLPPYLSSVTTVGADCGFAAENGGV